MNSTWIPHFQLVLMLCFHSNNSTVSHLQCVVTTQISLGNDYRFVQTGRRAKLNQTTSLLLSLLSDSVTWTSQVIYVYAAIQQIQKEFTLMCVILYSAPAQPHATMCCVKSLVTCRRNSLSAQALPAQLNWTICNTKNLKMGNVTLDISIYMHAPVESASFIFTF